MAAGWPGSRPGTSVRPLTTRTADHDPGSQDTDDSGLAADLLPTDPHEQITQWEMDRYL